jgi:hypothetical protein
MLPQNNLYPFHDEKEIVMQKWFILLLTISLYQLAVLQVNAGENHLQNGGFEGYNPLTHWGRRTVPATGPALPTAVADQTIKKTGTQSLRLETFKNKALTILVAAPVPVVAGKTYQITGWIKGQNTQVSLRQDLINGEGRHIAERYKQNLREIGSFDWKQVRTRVAIQPGEKKLGFTLFIGKNPGITWLDEFVITELLPVRGSEVEFRMTPNYYTDSNVYSLPTGAPMILTLTAANPLQHTSKTPRVIIELPQGISLLGCDFDARQHAPPEAVMLNGKPYTRYDYQMGLPNMILRNIDFSRTAYGSVAIMIKATGAPSPSPIPAYISFKDETIHCRETTFQLKVIPALMPSHTPIQFSTGISTGTSLEFKGPPLEAWTKFYAVMGFNEIAVKDVLRVGSRRKISTVRNPTDIIQTLKRARLPVYCNTNRLVNGYMVRYTPFSSKVPKSAFIRRADGNIAKDAFDPAYIYRRGEWYLKSVNYVIDKALKQGFDHLWCNWEPYRYRGANGSFTDASLEDLAVHLKIPLATLKGMDAREIPKRYPAELMAFQSWQFGKAMAVLSELVKERGASIGKPINLLLCVGPNFLNEYRKGKKYWDYTACFRAKDFLKHMDRISSWHYLYFESKDMLDPLTRRKVELGYRRGEMEPLKNHTHRETLDEVEAMVTFIKKTCLRDGRAPIPYTHLTQNLQCNNWVVKPQAIGLQMLAAFLGGASGVQLYYFPMGYDGRYWQSAAAANALISRFESVVMEGDSLTDRFTLTPMTRLFAHPDYKDNLTLRAFRKNSRTVLALCNFDFTGTAVFKLTTASPDLRGDYKDPVTGNALTLNDKPTMLSLPPMTIQFFEFSQGKIVAGQDRPLPANPAGLIAEQNIQFAARQKELRKLNTITSLKAEVDYSTLTPLTTNGWTASFDGTHYTVKRGDDSFTVLPKQGASIRSWVRHGREMVLTNQPLGRFGKERFYIPNDYMNHPDLTSSYEFIRHGVKNKQFEAVFQTRITSGELKGLILEKTIGLELNHKGLSLGYRITNSTDTAKLIGFWVFNAPADFIQTGQAKPSATFGSTKNDIIGKVCFFQNTDIPLLKGYESKLLKICKPALIQKQSAFSLSTSGLSVTAPEACAFLTWNITTPTTATLETIFPPQQLAPGDTWEGQVTFAKAPGFTGPESVTVDSGRLQLRFDHKKFWNLNRITFDGKVMGIDQPASHYGTVFSFPKTGFIGSGHTENESEVVKALHFFQNGQPLSVMQKEATLSAQAFRVERQSEIRHFKLNSSINIKNNVIEQSIGITAGKDEHLGLVFNFMHPWTVGMTHFLAKPSGANEAKGMFTTCGNRLVNKEMDWVVFFNTTNQTGVAMLLTDKADRGGAVMQLWDVAPYRKFYLACFTNQVFPKGYTANYRMRLGFFTAEKEHWQTEARKAVTRLKNVIID